MRSRTGFGIIIGIIWSTILIKAETKTLEFDSDDVDIPHNFTSSEHLQLEARDSEVDEEDGIVKQINPPTMVMTNDQPSHFYGFNNGEPFILDKIPETEGDSKNSDRTTVSSGLGDYYEDIEGDDKHVIIKDNEHYKGDSIDRKDSVHKYYRPNDIPSNPFKITSDLHQFLNLPVHYSTSDKFPMISNSYANMKIQGTGSNHRQSSSTSSTTSTASPSYYTLTQSSSTTYKPVTTITTPKTVSTTKQSTATTVMTTSTTTTEPTTTKRIPSPSSTTKRPSIFDYEDLTYSDYDYDTSGTGVNYQQKPGINEYDQPIIKSTSPKPTVPTTEKFEIKTPATTTTTTTTTTPAPSTTRPTTIHTSPSTTVQRATTTSTPKVSIVTSLPIDSNSYYTNEGLSAFSKLSENAEKSTQSTKTSDDIKPNQYSTTYSAYPPHGSNNIRFGDQNEKPINNFDFNRPDEPFRPIHNPEQYQQKNSSQKPVTTPAEIGNSYYLTTPQASNVYQPGGKKPVPPHAPPKPSNLEYHPHSNVPTRTPIKSENQYQQKPMHPIQSGPMNQQYRPVSNVPPFQPQPQLKPSINKYNMSYHTPPELRPPNAPIKKPADVVPPSKISNPDTIAFVNMKPGKIQQNIQVPPVKGSNIIQGHPMNDFDSQSYSLQTSFSIGAPDNDNSASNNGRPGHGQGIGQVLPVNEEHEETRPNQGLNSQRLTQTLRPNMGQPHNKHIASRPPQNKPVQRPPGGPGMPLPVRPPPNRPQPMQDMKQPQGPPPQGNNYPRPHWEPHSGKPQFMNGNNQLAQNGVNQHQQPAHSKDKGHNQYYQMNRGKNENDNKQTLPNILPQFRPNAKVGVAEYPSQFNGNHPQAPKLERRKEPTDRLRPPPLPRPQFLRINRNDDENSMVDEEIREMYLYPEKESRTNQRPSTNSNTQASRVTTLQMMQHGSGLPPQRLVRNEESEESKPADKSKPVHLVYPITKNSQQKNEGVVIVGVKGPQRPVPPPDLDLADDDQTFPIGDKQKPFPLPSRDRLDTPILKTKLNIKPIKNEFPYPLIKPDSNSASEDSSGSENKYHDLTQNNIKPDKNIMTEYNAYSPTKRTDIDVEDDMTKLADEAVNLIPYLQDYMPYATKKPSIKMQTKTPVYKKEPVLNWGVEKYEGSKPISVTLFNSGATSEAVFSTENHTTAGTTTKSYLEPTYPGPIIKDEGDRRVAIINKNSNDNEYTLSTVMHTHSNQKDNTDFEQISSSGYLTQDSLNHRPQQQETLMPQSVHLEAPFQASISAPQHETHGWSVIGSIRRPEDELDRRDSNHTTHQTEAQTEESAFDFDNFKPQLMGGFKPILPPSAKDTALETDQETKPLGAEEM